MRTTSRVAAYRHWYLITVYLITVPEYHGCSGGYSGVHSVHRGTPRVWCIYHGKATRSIICVILLPGTPML